jgi:hypothetical protein
VLINIEISGRRNGTKKETEKILKYKNLTIEIQRIWNVNTKAIQVKTGTTETISKSFREYLNNRRGKHDVEELQKTAILGTAHVLMLKCKTLVMGNNITCTIHCNDKIAATLHTLETWFVSGT